MELLDALDVKRSRVHVFLELAVSAILLVDLTEQLVHVSHGCVVFV